MSTLVWTGPKRSTSQRALKILLTSLGSLAPFTSVASSVERDYQAECIDALCREIQAGLRKLLVELAKLLQQESPRAQ